MNGKDIVRNLMMHMQLCLAILCIGILSACSQEEAKQGPEPEPLLPMSFGSDMVTDKESSSRASVVGLQNYTTSFYVYGYKTDSDDALQEVFPGYWVNYIGNSAHTTLTNSCGWEYDGITYSNREQSVKYWDTSAQEYRIFGVTSPAVPVVSTGTALTFTLSNLDANDMDASPFFSELWRRSYADLPTCATAPVQLVFTRPFCKVRFLFVDEGGSQFTDKLLLKNQKFFPAVDNEKLIVKGSFALTYPISKDAASTYSYQTTADTETGSTLEALTEPYETGTAAFAQSLEKWYTLIPPSSQGDYKMTAEVVGENRTVVIASSLMQWKPGYAYTYMFKITLSGSITLVNVSQVAVKDWEDVPVDHPVYNW